MLKKYLLPVLALTGVGLGGVAAVRSAISLVPTPMVSEAPTPPYDSFVAGAGVVEANTENIALGTNLPGIVTRIYVEIGSRVAKGDPLFSIDDRATRAVLASQEAAAKVAESQFAQADYEFKIREKLAQKHVISVEDLNLRRYAAGTAFAQLGLARAQVIATEVDLDKQTVHAPIAGQILQMKIHLGEFAQVGVLSPPLMLMGNVEPLHIRTDVDENEAWRVRDGASAVGFLRGNAKMTARLRFVRFEPYVVPKVSLSGASTERVDTRVMQVIYALDADKMPVKLGQQMDVYIDASVRP